MRIHVTNVYGFSPRSVVQLSQHEVVDILKDLCNDFSEQNRDKLEEIKNDILQDYKRV